MRNTCFISRSALPITVNGPELNFPGNAERFSVLREHWKRRVINRESGRNKIVVTRCHVFMAVPVGISGDWPIPEDSRRRVTVAYRMKIARTKKSTLYDVGALVNVPSEVSEEFNANDPGYRRQSEGVVSRNKRRPIDILFFFHRHKSDVKCSPESNSMIEKLLQIAVTYLC